MKKTLILMFVVLLYSLSSAQNPGDPGAPDTVYFCGVKSYVYGPPFSGNIRIDVCFFNDEDLRGVVVPLRWAGPVEFNSGTFLNTRAESLFAKILTIDQVNRNILIVAAAFTTGPEFIWAGNGRLVTLMGTVSDTGGLILDSTRFDSYSLYFTPELAYIFVPLFKKLEFQIKSDSIKPGDINQSGEVDLEDLIGIVNHLFRRMSIDFKPAADVNADCRISPADIVTMINHIFKSGPQPRPGCVWD